MFSIDAIMSTDLVTLRPESTVADARSLMQSNRIHHLPVIEGEDNLVGLVTLTNVLAATDSFLRDPDNRIHATDLQVKDIMVTDIATLALAMNAITFEARPLGEHPTSTSPAAISGGRRSPASSLPLSSLPSW